MGTWRNPIQLTMPRTNRCSSGIEFSTQVVYTNVASGSLDWWLLLALTFALGLVLRARTRHDPAE